MKSELSENRKSDQNQASGHLGATLLIQFTTHRSALRFLAVVYKQVVQVKTVVGDTAFREILTRLIEKSPAAATAFVAMIEKVLSNR
ncbi:MAG: hypothetical protein JKY95_19820 [Planctomycetaceae bacterium]|nr:hypothetical protein [Planctomycetaceae bacterium]